jgi:hypothetical protein
MSKLKETPLTSQESAVASAGLARNLRDRIKLLARRAGGRGITLSEAAEAIPDHKLTSITPRFSELVERGQLVRVRVGYGKPTKRYPRGQCRYTTRFDEQTRRNVIVHWAPEFAPPSPIQEEPTHDANGTTEQSANSNREDDRNS